MPILSVDGINGTGKTTLAKNLAIRLKEEGYDAVYAKLPGQDGLPVCEKIREILNTNESLSNYTQLYLFLADMSEFYSKMDPMKVYVLDRSYLSTMTYQSLAGVPMNLIRQCITNTLFYTDFLIFLTADPTVAWNRVQARLKTTGNPGGYANNNVDYYDTVQRRYHLCLTHFNMPCKKINTTTLTPAETGEKGYISVKEFLNGEI
jgi:dTMP kinase